MTSYPVVDRFLSTITSAGFGVDPGVYATTAHLDATVPGWRFTCDGADAIHKNYSRWFADPGTFAELHRTPIDSGEVVEYTLCWVEGGVPHAAHHLHVLKVDAAADRIVEDRVFCGGRWDQALLDRMGKADAT
jgi:hypothetical protein